MKKDIKPAPYLGFAATIAAAAAVYAKAKNKDVLAYTVIAGGIGVAAGLVTYGVRGGT